MMSLWHDELSQMAVTRVYVLKGCLCWFLLLQEALQVLASGSEPGSFKITASALDMNLVRLCVCPVTAQSVAYNAPVLPYKRSVDFQKLGCILFICFYFLAELGLYCHVVFL